MESPLIMSFPSIAVLEELVPELARLAHYPKSSQKQIDNFSTLIQTAALRWLIERSLYDTESDFFIEIESEWFDCATWINKVYQKIPDAKQKTLEYYLLGEYTAFYQNKWKKSVITRYKIYPNILKNILNIKLFNITDKTLRNNFQRLSKIANPKLIKADHTRGKYKKKSTLIYHENSNFELNQDHHLTIEDDSWEFLDEGVSAIAELLLTKINGSQRLFLQTEYVLEEETQEIVEDWADKLRLIWQSQPVSLVKIEYYSPSQNKTDSYIIYPVCLHYYQRAYYLSAVGDNPLGKAFLEANWYNYRLDRIINLEKLSWYFSDKTKLLKSKIYIQNQINYLYTPEYIQEQLRLAYGLDFYRKAKIMLLRFNYDYYQKYIKNTIRHDTFKQLNSIQEVKSFINQQQILEKKEKDKIFKIVEHYDLDSYYKMCYRVGDHNVMMRLRSWGANVEVLFPLYLRKIIKQDVQKTYLLY